MLSSTASRTESPMVGALFSGFYQEGGATMLAHAFNGTTAPSWGSLSRDEWDIVRNQVSPGSLGIASDTRGDQVQRIVVASVAVQMVGDDCINPAKSNSPNGFLATPMARVFTGADLVEQDETMWDHSAAGPSKWVPMNHDSGSVLTGLASPPTIPTVLRAVRNVTFRPATRAGELAPAGATNEFYIDNHVAMITREGCPPWPEGH